jgi:hypothetical protein
LNRGGGKATVYHLVNGQWQTVESTASGHYLLVTMTGAAGTFCIQSVPSGSLLPILLAAAGVLLLLAAVLLFDRRHRRRARKAAASNAEPPSSSK